MKSDNDVMRVLKEDGIEHVSEKDMNLEIVALDDVIGANSHHKSWSRRLVQTVNGSAMMISQQPGEGNRYHYHPDYNECWYIVDGEYEMTIGEKKRKEIIKKGDFVFMEAGKWHQMKAVGDKPAVRIGFSHSMATHTYEGK